jgi:hypothetical protein
MDLVGSAGRYAIVIITHGISKTAASRFEDASAGSIIPLPRHAIISVRMNEAKNGIRVFIDFS